MTRSTIAPFVAIRSGASKNGRVTRQLPAPFLAVLLVLFAAPAQSQDEIVVGLDESRVGIPIGTKIVDIGFTNNRHVNVVTLKRTQHILIRWKFNSKWVERYIVKTCIPQCTLTNKSQGLIPLDEIPRTKFSCMRFVTMQHDPLKTSYLLSSPAFSYCIQVVAVGANDSTHSQILYVKNNR